MAKELETEKDELITMNMRQKNSPVDVAVGATGSNCNTNNDVVLCIFCINPVGKSDSNHTKITSDRVVTNHLDHAKTTGDATGPNFDAILQVVPGAI